TIYDFYRINNIDDGYTDNYKYIDLTGYNSAFFEVNERIIIKEDWIYRFTLIQSKETNSTSEMVFANMKSSIELRGTPSQYPDYVNINAEISDFEFTPLKFPYDDGPGLIINTYGTNSHTGSNLYAFDLCTGIKCPE